MRRYDLIIAGAGAAGVMAAGIAASAGCNVLLCEKMEKPQRKVRITGKGRCNLTNMRSEAEFLEKVRSSAGFFSTALHRFSSRDTVAFFERIGVPLTVERGERVFPASSRAWDIAEAHVRWCRAQGAEIACHTRVTDIHTKDGRVSGVTLESPQGGIEQVTTRCVIIATGGASYPATGSTGDGYMLAHRLGHTIVEIRPSLTPLESDAPWIGNLQGLSLRNAGATLLIDGQPTRQEFGEIEFTPYVSGPVTLRLSRLAVDSLIEGRLVEIALDLKPALSAEKLLNRIDREAQALGPGNTTQALLRKLLPAQMIRPFACVAGLSPDQPAHSLTESDRSRIVCVLKDFRLPVSDYRPFTEAIVTAGGVSTDEVDPATMQSRLVAGLYFAGEILDIDADTGGYNLQVAYSTGHLAGQLFRQTTIDEDNR